MMGPVIPVPVPQPLADALTAVQVTTTAGQSSGFQLTFAVSKRSVIQQVMLPTGASSIRGLRVILVILLTGSPTVLMDGIVTRQDLAPSDTPGGVHAHPHRRGSHRPDEPGQQERLLSRPVQRRRGSR